MIFGILADESMTWASEAVLATEKVELATASKLILDTWKSPGL